ncbi:MAG: AAA family ATPase [Lentisphaerae bacterium]|nr:AAA family ATPase [Lentisphaerota bacterium]
MNTTVKKAKSILDKFVKNQLAGGASQPVMLWGPPGIGKSDIVKSVAQESSIELRDIRLAQQDPVDLRGVPTVEAGQTKWATPSCFPTDPESAGIIFLDELSAADPSIQVAAYQLLLDRRIGEYIVPSKWMIVAAGNRAEDNAVSLPMSSALANRMMHLELHAEPEEWARWASEHGLDPSLIGFIRFRPEMLFAPGENCERGWPSPRSWTSVSKVLEIGLDDDELSPCIAGLVGDGAAAQFLAYRKQFRALGDVRAMMLDPGKPLKLNDRKPDVCYALASALAYWVGRGSSPEETSLLLDGFFRLSMSLPATFAVLAMIDVLEKDKDGVLSEQMTAHPDFTAWQARFGNNLNRRR